MYVYIIHYKHTQITHVHTHTHTSGAPCRPRNAYIYIYIYIHTYIHTYTQTGTYSHKRHCLSTMHWPQFYIYTYKHSHTHTQTCGAHCQPCAGPHLARGAERVQPPAWRQLHRVPEPFRREAVSPYLYVCMHVCIRMCAVFLGISC